MLKEYNKLVRDLIPQIIESSGKQAQIRIANEHEFLRYLKQKLLEEVDEYLQSESVEELADILEVLNSLCTMNNLNLSGLIKLADEKKKTRGGFEKRIILQSVTTKK
jgi:predicted house-cleaning noncanonical NTP pyrophosphatase (MazG superfamily)